MIDFSDALRHLYVPKLNEVGPNLQLGLNPWLVAGSGYYIASPHLTNDFSIRTFDIIDFLKPYSFDINRLSCASSESLKDIEPKKWQTKFIGWNITKFYYSAFFSAHCILKITGNSLSNIEKNSITKIKTITSAAGYSSQNLNTGLYCIDISGATNTVRFFKQSQYDDSHQGLWKYFLHFLNNSKAGIYRRLPLSEAQKIIDKIDELIKALTNCSSGNGHWLSKIRNEVNYSQGYGTWFPYKGYMQEYDQIYSFMPLSKNNPMTIDLKSYAGKDILYFVRTCQLINAISNNLLTDLASRHPSNKSFVKLGIQQFENLYAVNKG